MKASQFPDSKDGVKEGLAADRGAGFCYLWQRCILTHCQKVIFTTMAINAAYFSVLMDVINLFANRGLTKPVATACLSYPDVLVAYDVLSRSLSPEALEALPRRPDSDAIRAHHGYTEGFGDIVETSDLLRLLGLEPVFFDIAEHRGGEVIIDLNEELPEHLQQRFDLVLDTGTLEHCFNVGMAFKSMCSLVKEGGIVITSGPLSLTNHGFWNFSPTAYYDFFTHNGFKVMKMAGLAGPTQEEIMDLPHVARFVAPPEAGIMCVAKRMEMRPLGWPVQSKYQDRIKAKS